MMKSIAFGAALASAAPVDFITDGFHNPLYKVEYNSDAFLSNVTYDAYERYEFLPLVKGIKAKWTFDYKANCKMSIQKEDGEQDNPEYKGFTYEDSLFKGELYFQVNEDAKVDSAEAMKLTKTCKDMWTETWNLYVQVVEFLPP